MTLYELSQKLTKLAKKVGQQNSEILVSTSALTGEVIGCYKFGINKTTGDLYYKALDGTWQLATSGGSGGGGLVSKTIRISGIIGDTPTYFNTSNTITGFTDGSTVLQTVDFENSIVYMIIGNIPVMPIDPQNGDTFLTKAINSNTLTLSSVFNAGDPVDIFIFSTDTGSGGAVPGLQEVSDVNSITTNEITAQSFRVKIDLTNEDCGSVVGGTNSNYYGSLYLRDVNSVSPVYKSITTKLSAGDGNAESVLYLPDGDDKYFALSVLGNYADNLGNITVPLGLQEQTNNGNNTTNDIYLFSGAKLFLTDPSDTSKSINFRVDAATSLKSILVPDMDGTMFLKEDPIRTRTETFTITDTDLSNAHNVPFPIIAGVAGKKINVLAVCYQTDGGVQYVNNPVLQLAFGSNNVMTLSKVDFSNANVTGAQVPFEIPFYFSRQGLSLNLNLSTALITPGNKGLSFQITYNITT